MVTEEQLPGWLLEQIPELREIYDSPDLPEWVKESPVSAYSVFNHVLRPYLAGLMQEPRQSELRRAFGLLDYLANNGDTSVQNELRVVTEEDMRLRPFWDLLGEKMRQNHIDDLTWFPEWRDRQTRMNTHVDKTRYRQRWLEEVERIGGFQNMTDEHHVSIRNRLGREFGIEAAYL